MTETIEPGRPGRGYDPTAGFTDLQWYMFHQQNVAYFAAFASGDIDEATALERARAIVGLFPHLSEAYRGATPGSIPDALLRQLIAIESVPTLEGLPDAWLVRGTEVYADPALPYFRIRIGRLAGGPDERGRRAFILFWASHVFAEGTDSARLSRSQPSAHEAQPPAPATRTPVTFAAKAFAALAVPLHLIASRIVTPHPGRIMPVTRAYPRRAVADLARQLSVRQRSLLMALVGHVIAGGGLRSGKSRMSTTYSVIDEGGGASRDTFMRMRMMLASLDNRPDFAAFARAVDARLTRAEAKESGFNAEMNAAAIGFHRNLARRVPFIYGPEVFAFMPYDFVFGLIPPHRLAGPLAEGLVEPVYAGATMPGVNGCVVVPGRRLISFNFQMEERLHGNVARLDRILT
jgi:hypothetical protein